jgi:MtN3 and saliva related transmembrane protein
MTDFDPTWVGTSAAILTTIAFAPQAIKAWRSRATSDVSLAMLLMLTIGVVLWLTYGLLIGDGPLIAANTITLVLALAILAAKIRYH